MIDYFKVNGKTVVIDFDKIFGDQELAVFNTFHMVHKSKRFYADNASIFVEGCNKILSKDKELAEALLYQYLLLKRGIDGKKFGTNYNSFINILISTLFTYQPFNGNMSILDLIRKYVDEEYVDHIDPTYEINAAKYEQSIMFFKRHYKILFQITSLSYFVIPICIHYVYKNPEIDMDADTFIYIVIMELMGIIKYADEEDIEPTNIYNKLYRHVHKYISRAVLTDQQGMKRLEIYGTTTDSTVEMIMKKLITNILPKYKFNGDIMKFNQSVIRTSFEIYTLRKKDPIQTRCLINDTDSFADEENGIDVFDRYNKPRDEKIIIYRKYLTSMTMDSIAKKHQITWSQDEFDWYFNTIDITPLQIALVSQILSKEFEGSENIFGCSKSDIIKGIIILHKRMLRLNLVHLANHIVAKKTSTILSKCQMKSIIKKIQNHPLYNQVIDERYKFIKEMFINKMMAKSDKNHPIIELMKMLLNETYMYNGFKDPDNGKVIPKNEDILLNEVLNIYQLMIC